MNTDGKQKPVCFAVMPISDHTEYAPGHFTRVYDYLIKPACEDAGFSPVRADEVKNTNHIVLDVLKRLLTADLVICDLSSRNPNVLYELGIRQAFDQPVTLIKDNKTDRIFDIQGLRTYEYDETLRIDSVTRDKIRIAQALKATYEEKGKDINSLVRLLSVSRAEIKEHASLSVDTSILLNAMRDLSERMTNIEKNARKNGYLSEPYFPSAEVVTLPNGEPIKQGWPVYGKNSEELGTFQGFNQDGIVLRDARNTFFVISPDSDEYMKLNTLPF